MTPPMGVCCRRRKGPATSPRRIKAACPFPGGGPVEGTFIPLRSAAGAGAGGRNAGAELHPPSRSQATRQRDALLRRGLHNRARLRPASGSRQRQGTFHAAYAPRKPRPGRVRHHRTREGAGADVPFRSARPPAPGPHPCGDAGLPQGRENGTDVPFRSARPPRLAPSHVATRASIKGREAGMDVPRRSSSTQGPGPTRGGCHRPGAATGRNLRATRGPRGSGCSGPDLRGPGTCSPGACR
jgi:hypothetical protein